MYDVYDVMYDAGKTDWRYSLGNDNGADFSEKCAEF